MVVSSIRRFTTIALIAGLFASFAVTTNAVVNPQPTLAVSCSVDAPGAPYKVSGPAVAARGTARCTDSVYQLQVRIRIYARDCGTCAQYLFRNSGYLSGPNTAYNSRTTSGVCSGTRQYFVHVDGQWTMDGRSWLFIPGKSSWWTTISC